MQRREFCATLASTGLKHAGRRRFTKEGEGRDSSSGMDGRRRPSLHRNGSSFLFLVGRTELLDQGVDFFELQFVGILGHVSLAVVDDLGEVVGGGGGDFFGDEGGASEMAAFGSFAVALR